MVEGVHCDLINKACPQVDQGCCKGCPIARSTLGATMHTFTANLAINTGHPFHGKIRTPLFKFLDNPQTFRAGIQIRDLRTRQKLDLKFVVINGKIDTSDFEIL